MKILITGGNGNIAKIIKKHLSQEYNITCITRNDFDITDQIELENYMNNNSFDILIHTAIIGGRRTKDENGDVVYKNLLMFENLIKYSHKFKLIINLDSAAIYDRSTDIYCRKEHDIKTIPLDYYGFSKYLIYKRILAHDNVINFRIFNIFHINEEPDRFIKACFIAKKNKTQVKIFQDKYFDFMYEDDFIKVLNFYLINYSNDLPKSVNLSYINKYKLSDIAFMILNDKEQIIIEDTTCKNNYCGDGTLLHTLNINLDGIENSIIKYERNFTF